MTLKEKNNFAKNNLNSNNYDFTTNIKHQTSRLIHKFNRI
ncbi:hypothetical protein LEP1GSC065_3557 [Leptospira kirschneri serovar Sokoine str. RM1]|nr:hypothetical protein LEP1GSC065_3557 [Leptospira kirschneri serovar Sokoine str. RM1]